MCSDTQRQIEKTFDSSWRKGLWQHWQNKEQVRAFRSLQAPHNCIFKALSSSGFHLPLFFVLEMIQDIQDNLIAEDVLILQGEEDHSAYYVSNAALGASAWFGVRVLFCLFLWTDGRSLSCSKSGCRSKVDSISPDPGYSQRLGLLLAKHLPPKGGFRMVSSGFRDSQQLHEALSLACNTYIYIYFLQKKFSTDFLSKTCFNSNPYF